MRCTPCDDVAGRVHLVRHGRICGQVAVEPQAGGKNGGGAMLTPFAEKLVARYRKIERDAARAVHKDLEALRSDITRSRKSS